MASPYTQFLSFPCGHRFWAKRDGEWDNELILFIDDCWSCTGKNGAHILTRTTVPDWDVEYLRKQYPERLPQRA